MCIGTFGVLVLSCFVNGPIIRKFCDLERNETSKETSSMVMSFMGFHNNSTLLFLALPVYYGVNIC